MTTLGIDGIGFWASGLPGWDAARAFVAGGTLVDGTPRKPVATLLAPNERRRAPDTVALALHVAQAACEMAGADPAQLPSVFTSMHGELAITDYMCATLADAPLGISPTRFHNSVHNAAAGYWTIGTHCMQPATAISAYRASFAQGLLEAAAQLVDGATQVLLVAYDADAPGPLGPISRSEGLLGGALVLRLADDAHPLRLQLELRPGDAVDAGDALSRQLGGNAMAPMLPLFAALAGDGASTVELTAAHGQRLQLQVRR